MNKIYVIVECDRSKTWDSFQLKGMSTDEAGIRKEFKRLCALFTAVNPDGWFLLLTSYAPDAFTSLDSNLLKDLTILEEVGGAASFENIYGGSYSLEVE